MPIFSVEDDRSFMEGVNAELYQLYYHDIKVYKLSFTTATVDRLYHEDVNFDIADQPNYLVPGYINVSDNGLASLKKAGQEIDRQLVLYFSRKLLENTLTKAGLDKYTDIPTDGDVVEIQNSLWSVITVDPDGYHTNERRNPFDYIAIIEPWGIENVPRPRKRRR